jgi:chromosome segregation ATPase
MHRVQVDQEQIGGRLARLEEALEQKADRDEVESELEELREEVEDLEGQLADAESRIDDLEDSDWT